MSASKLENKRQKERHQKCLLELANQPGNNICADCKRSLPRWASSSLGIFICVNCARIHRKMGPTISKVKSLTMDNWTEEQVEFMRSMGNERSNSMYNPNDLRNPPPADETDDFDRDIEAYIRAKYIYKKFTDERHPVPSTFKLVPSKHRRGLTPRVSKPVSLSQEQPQAIPPNSDSLEVRRQGFQTPENTESELMTTSPPNYQQQRQPLLNSYPVEPAHIYPSQIHPFHPILPLPHTTRSSPSVTPLVSQQKQMKRGQNDFQPDLDNFTDVMEISDLANLDNLTDSLKIFDLDHLDYLTDSMENSDLDNSSPAQEEPGGGALLRENIDFFAAVSAEFRMIPPISQQETSINVVRGAPNMCWIAAEEAMQHLLRQSTFIDRTFEQSDIPQSLYFIQPGFDESLITTGVGYLEQIHIFLAVDLDATSPGLLSDLGKICSPFSSILFTPSQRHFLPVFKDNGSIWDPNEFVHLTTRKMANDNGHFDISLDESISLSLARDIKNDAAGGNFQETPGGGRRGGGPSSNKGKGKETEPPNGNESDGGEPGGDGPSPPDDPEDPPEGDQITHPDTKNISFEICSSIFSTSGSINRVQKINVAGGLTIKTIPLTQNPPRPPSRQVNFTRLVFNTKPDFTFGYRQLHVKVAIDSKQEVAVIEAVHPTRTSYYHEGETVSSSSSKTKLRRGITSLTSMVPRLQLSVQNTDQEIVGIKNRRNRSTISQYEDDGAVHWGFQIGDPNLQKEGIDMRAQQVLPSVDFLYVGNSDSAPEPPPSNIETVIASLWSMIPQDRPDESNNPWIQDLLNKFKSKGKDQQPAYSNLFNVIFVQATLDSSSKTHSSHYKANLIVKQGVTESVEVKRPADEQFKFEPITVNDLTDPATSGIPMIGDVKPWS